MKPLNPRHQVICDLCPEADIIIDVGADHGYVAKTLGAIGSERMPHRRGRTLIPWVIADGLKPYAKADVAVIAGMGAAKIAAILSDAPFIPVLIVHATDSPGALRKYLSCNGWMIDKEVLVPEGKGHAVVIRAQRGQEPSVGLDLEFGPHLCHSQGPYHRTYFQNLLHRWQHIARSSRGSDPSRSNDALSRAHYLKGVLHRLA